MWYRKLVFECRGHECYNFRYHTTYEFDNCIINRLWTINIHKQDLEVWSLLSAMCIWNSLLIYTLNMFCNFYPIRIGFYNQILQITVIHDHLILWRSIPSPASVRSEIIKRYLVTREVDNIKLLDEEETRNTIYVASVSEPHKYALLERGVAEPNNGVFLTKRSWVKNIVLRGNSESNSVIIWRQKRFHHRFHVNLYEVLVNWPPM